MPSAIIDLLGTPHVAQTLTGAAPTTTPVALSPPGGYRWTLHLNYEGLAGGDVGSDTFIPILQASFDGGTVYQDIASAASMAGGVVTAVNEFIEACTPPAAARKAASDAAIAASTINQVGLGTHVRIKGKIVDANANASWRINKAFLVRYDP